MTNSESTNLAIPPVSVVVAVYNSEATLVQLVDRLHAVLMSCKNAFEIILVNDGSFVVKYPASLTCIHLRKRFRIRRWDSPSPTHVIVCLQLMDNRIPYLFS